MSNTAQHPAVPAQKTGNESNTEAVETLPDEQSANDFFSVAKQRLLNVNNWQRIAGAATANFELTDERGVAVNRDVQQGDHFKIDVPGPGPATGGGYDWVRVEAVEETTGENESCVLIRVRPATNPTNERQDVAHFFSDEATSNFIVKREGNTVTAAVIGRNEKPNTGAEKNVDKMRNAAMATGAVNGFAKLQWKNLVNGLVQKNADD